MHLPWPAPELLFSSGFPRGKVLEIQMATSASPSPDSGRQQDVFPLDKERYGSGSNGLILLPVRMHTHRQENQAFRPATGRYNSETGCIKENNV
jgi:hypothetical protein